MKSFCVALAAVLCLASVAPAAHYLVDGKMVEGPPPVVREDPHQCPCGPDCQCGPNCQCNAEESQVGIIFQRRARAVECPYGTDANGNCLPPPVANSVPYAVPFYQPPTASYFVAADDQSEVEKLRAEVSGLRAEVKAAKDAQYEAGRALLFQGANGTASAKAAAAKGATYPLQMAGPGWTYSATTWSDTANVAYSRARSHPVIRLFSAPFRFFSCRG